jgi:penicillin V acylase-like amidase (Ntn superfamily)
MELNRFCTSIVAVQADGKIVHGRNLDYNFQEYLTNLTLIARFERNGKVLFLILFLSVLFKLYI